MARSEALRLEAGGFEEAAPPPDHVKLRNAKLLSPLYHGDGCTGLSGLYAIVNGLRLAVAHKRAFTAAELDLLMSAGLRFISGRLSPEQAVLRGLRVGLWRALAEALAEVMAGKIGAWVRVERLFIHEPEREATFAALHEAILNWRVPLILCRGGQYTAVSGFTRSSLLLFDSGGACWLSKRVCGVPGDRENSRHLLYPSSFLALSA